MTTTDDQNISAHIRVQRAIEQIRRGGMVIMTDDEDRENEGDLILAAEDATPAAINFMAKEARGLICLSLSPGKIADLKLPLMASGRAPGHGTVGLSTAFTVSVEARDGVTTGISAADRARTIEVVMADNCGPEDIVVPGHVFPLQARPGGVLERVGHTEGSVDLAKLAGKKPGAVICEIMNDDGSMARRPELEQFAERHNLPIVGIDDLVNFRLSNETLIKEVSRGPFQTPLGTCEGIVFENQLNGSQHLALMSQIPATGDVCHVRVQKNLAIGDCLGHFVDGPEVGGRQLIDYGLELLATKKPSVFLYLSSGGPSGVDTKPDPRQIGIGAQILKELGVEKMHLHVTGPKNLVALDGFGLQVVATTVIQPDQTCR